MKNQQNNGFILVVAGQTVRVNALFPWAKVFCGEYASKNPIDESEVSFNVTITQEDIVFERQKSRSENIKEGISVRDFSDEYLETLAVYRKIAEEFIERDILLFHGSVIAVDGQGYLFTAKSGTGKSTHTRLWREVFGNRAIMVNDDKPLIKITEHGAIAYGTPWDGKHHLSSNIAVPLKGVCILRRGKENQIRKITIKEAYPMLIQQSYRSFVTEKMIKSLSLIDKLAAGVSLYELNCNMERQAALVAYAGMNSLESE